MGMPCLQVAGRARALCALHLILYSTTHATAMRIATTCGLAAALASVSTTAFAQGGGFSTPGMPTRSAMPEQAKQETASGQTSNRLPSVA